MAEIQFTYAKAKDHRTVMISGAFGGLNMNGYLTVNFYIDKNEVPDTATYEVKEDGTAIEKSKTPSGANLVREVLMTGIMDLETMKSFHAWIGQKIDEKLKADYEVQRMQEKYKK